METSRVLWSQEHAHPPEEVLERYAMWCSPAKAPRQRDHHAQTASARATELTEEEMELVEEHILFCAACRELLDEADSWVALMKAAASTAPEAAQVEARLPFWRRWLAAASEVAGSLTAIPRPALAGGFAAILAIFLLAPAIVQKQQIPETQTITLAAVRGAELKVPAKAGAPIILNLDEDPKLMSTFANVTIVDPKGKPVWTARLEAGSSTISIQIPPLKKGTYWVRFHSDPKEEPLKEYGLAVE